VQAWGCKAWFVVALLIFSDPRGQTLELTLEAFGTFFVTYFYATGVSFIANGLVLMALVRAMGVCSAPVKTRHRLFSP